MKNFSIEELKTLLADVKNKDDRKTFYVIAGVFVAVLAITVGLVALLIKKHCDCCDYDDMYDEWDDEDECFEDDFDDKETEKK